MSTRLNTADSEVAVANPDTTSDEIYESTDDIDWNEIITSTQDDYLAGRFEFNSADYPTDDAALAAMKQWFADVLQETLSEIAAVRPLNAARSDRH